MYPVLGEVVIPVWKCETDEEDLVGFQDVFSLMAEYWWWAMAEGMMGVVVDHLLEVLEPKLWVGVVERPKMGWWPSEQWFQRWFQSSV